MIDSQLEHKDTEIFNIKGLWLHITTFQGQKNKSKKVKSGEAKPDQAPSSSEKSLSYFKDIDSDKIQQLYKHYKYDFEIFDYSADEYFEL